MAITVTIDRFEGEIAVLLVCDEETVVNVHRSDLPPGARQGDVLRLEATVDYEETKRRREAVRAKIERLKHRSEEKREVRGWPVLKAELRTLRFCGGLDGGGDVGPGQLAS